MSLLQWRDATRGDRGALQRFKCTDEEMLVEYSATGVEYVHPKMYEYRVQELVRRLKPPQGRRYTVRVGCDGAGVAAVSVSEELRAGELYELNFAALHCRMRGLDGGHAVEMMEDTLDRITSACREFGSRTAEVFGYIDPENANSKRMCTHVGLKFDALIEERDGTKLEIWKYELPVEP